MADQDISDVIRAFSSRIERAERRIQILRESLLFASMYQNVDPSHFHAVAPPAKWGQWNCRFHTRYHDVGYHFTGTASREWVKEDGIKYLKQKASWQTTKYFDFEDEKYREFIATEAITSPQSHRLPRDVLDPATHNTALYQRWFPSAGGKNGDVVDADFEKSY